MNHKTLARVLCVLLCAVLVGSALLIALPALRADAAAAPVANGRAVVTEDYVNLRAGAGYDFSTVSVLRKNAAVYFTDAVLYNDGWYRVSDPVAGKTGYIRHEYVAAVEDGAAIRLSVTSGTTYVGCQYAFWQTGAQKPVWRVSDASVADIDENGVLTAKKAGRVSVICAEGSRTAVCSLVVKNASPVDLSAAKTLLIKNTTALLTSSTAGVKWYTSNQNVAVVSGGRVFARAAGFATITAYTATSASTCLVQVTDAAKSNPIALNVRYGTCYTGCQYGFWQTGAQNPVWSVSDPTVASIDRNGILTAAKTGSVTVSCSEGDRTGTCLLTVKSGPSTNISETKLTLVRGTQAALRSSVSNVKWYSSNTNVATVSNGVVTAKGAGIAVIAAYTDNAASTCLLQVTDSPSASGVSLNVQTASLYAGNQYVFRQTGAQNPVWSVSDVNIATIDNGVLSAKSAGAVTVTVRDGDRLATCKLTVKPAASVGISASTLTVEAGKTAKLTTKTANTKWNSSDPAIVSVSNGVVTGVAEGCATVAAYTGTAASTCLVKVTAAKQVQPQPAPQPVQPQATGYTTADYLNVRSGAGTQYSILTTVPYGTKFTFLSEQRYNTDWYHVQLDGGVKGYIHRDYAEKIVPPVITLSASSASTYTGCQYAFRQTGAEQPTWSSTNTAVAVVDQNGVMTAKAAGTTVISASENGGIGSCTVTVKNGTPTGISASTLSLETGASARLTAKAGVNWFSSNPGVATVSGGVVTGKSVGYTTVSAYDANGASTCLVKVTRGKNAVKLLTGSFSTYKGCQYAIPCANADGAVWTSSNASVATVDKNGVVTAKAAGTATVTVSNSVSSASCTVTVRTGSAPGISLTSASVPAGKSILLTSGAGNWFSSNTDIATVKNGVVDTKKEGYVTVSAYTASGASTCLLHVTKANGVCFVYASPNSAPKNATVTFKAITDQTRTAVYFVVTNGADSYTVDATQKVADGNTYIWSGSKALPNTGVWKIKAYAKTASTDFAATDGDGEGEVFVTNATDKTTVVTGERRASNEIIQMIADFEGFLPTVTDDYFTGDPTLGHGKLVCENEQFYNNLTRSEAFAYLCQTVNSGSYTTVTNSFLTSRNAKFNQQQFDALVSFAYNLGVYALLDDDTLTGALLNNGANLAYTNQYIFTQQLLRYHHAGGCLWGLLYRRIDEAEVFFHGDYKIDGENNKYGIYFRCARNGSFGIG